MSVPQNTSTNTANSNANSTSTSLIKRVEFSFQELDKHPAVLTAINMVCKMKWLDHNACMPLAFHATQVLFEDMKILLNSGTKYMMTIAVDESVEKLIFRLDKYQEPLITTLVAKRIADKERNPNSNECTDKFMNEAQYPRMLVVMMTFKSKSDASLDIQAFQSPVDNKWYTAPQFDFMLTRKSRTIVIVNPLCTL